jgi:hypothetical protein
MKEKKYTSPNGVSYTILTSMTSCSPYQSIILSEENHILSFLSKPYHCISTFLKETQWKHILIQEFIEGIPIQLFYDKRIQSWEIATKNAIGGQYTPNKKTKTTVYKMFIDALGVDSLCHTPLLSELSTQHSYVFVLQHPAYQEVEYPALYLVSVYSLLQYIPSTEYELWDVWKNNKVLFPKTVSVNCYVELAKKYSYYMIHDFKKGFVLTENSGKKIVIQDKEYQERKKNTDSKIQYQYLCLYRIGKIKEFIQLFPEYKSVFYYWKMRYLDFVKKIHFCYYNVFVKKMVSLDKIRDKYYIHIWKLHHQIYIPNIKTAKKITIREVKKYIDSYEPHLQLYYMNLP